MRSAVVGAGAKSGLGRQRFDALDRIFVSKLPLERFGREVVDATTFAVAARPAQQACDVVAGGDALLRPIGRSCSLGLQLDEDVIALNACLRAMRRHERPFGAPGCEERLVLQMPSVLINLQREARRRDRVIRRSALAPACRRALIAKPLAYALLNAYVGVVLQLRGPRTFSPAGFSAAMQRVAVIAAKVPSVKQQRREFRSACA